MSRNEIHPINNQIDDESRRDFLKLLGVNAGAVMIGEIPALIASSPESQESQGDNLEFRAELIPVGAGEVQLSVSRRDGQTPEGTCKIVWTKPGEKRLSDIAINKRGWGEYNCATPDGPIMKLSEWQTGIVPGSDEQFSQVWVAVRTEGGWENAELHPITEQLLSQEIRESQVQYAMIKQETDLLTSSDQYGKPIVSLKKDSEVFILGEENEHYHVQLTTGEIGFVPKSLLELAEYTPEGERAYDSEFRITPVEILVEEGSVLRPFKFTIKFDRPVPEGQWWSLKFNGQALGENDYDIIDGDPATFELSRLWVLQNLGKLVWDEAVTGQSEGFHHIHEWSLAYLPTEE